MKKEIIIIGGGASGVSAALGFVKNGIVPTIIDVGNRMPEGHQAEGNLYDYRKENDLFDLMIGPELKGLSNIIDGTTLSPKLITPFNHYVISGADSLSPVRAENFCAVRSFASGGLAAAWGAGLYRYNRRELEHLPIGPDSLDPYYDLLSKEIGITGCNDDLAPFFGTDTTLMPKFRLSAKASHVYRNYEKKKGKLNRDGIYIGYPRLGVLTRNHKGRNKCDYSNFETWLPDIPWVYNPALTLDELIRKNKINYIDRILVDSWSRRNGRIVIEGNHIDSRAPFSIEAETLVIAAGTINTAKLVLRSKQDTKTRLPILDNPLLQVPLIFPSFLGSPLDRSAFGMTNLNLIYSSPDGGEILQGSIIELTSPPRSVFFENFPVSTGLNLRMIKLVSPAVMAMFLYYPSSDGDAGAVRLTSNHELEITQHDYRTDKKPLKKITRSLSAMGAWTHPLLVKQSKPGYAIHYAGTLPMKEIPASEYETAPDGELFREPGIYIADGSSFSGISSKNLSFTLMANAMRIADRISGKVKKQ